MDKEEIRTLVREEIRRAFQVLRAEAEDLDIPYDTAEITSRALGAVASAAERAADNVQEAHHALMCDAEYGGGCRTGCVDGGEG